jgi:hypothetical protein
MMKKMTIYRSPAEIDSLIHAFEECSMPRNLWTHEAHLTVGLWYLFDDFEEAAIAAMRNGIKRYNLACGVETTNDSGYHETLTVFWMRAISRYLASVAKNRSMVTLANGLIQKYADRTLPFRYYTRELLMSWEARNHWVEPDLRAIELKKVSLK